MSFSIAMAGIAIAGMVGNVANSGVNAGKNADKIRNEINNIKARTQNLQNKFNQIIRGSSIFNSEIEAEMVRDMDAIVSSHSKLKIVQENFIEIRKKIQISGIIFVIIIFFSLLLKFAVF